jgi:hypothetical protein
MAHAAKTHIGIDLDSRVPVLCKDGWPRHIDRLIHFFGERPVADPGPDQWHRADPARP